MATYTLEQYLFDPEFIATGDGHEWVDQDQIIGETDAKISYVEALVKNFTTDIFVSNFDLDETLAFLDLDSDFEVISIKYYINYKIELDSLTSASVSMNFYLNLDATPFPVTPNYLDTTYDITDSGVKTAVITYSTEYGGAPSINQLLALIKMQANFSFTANEFAIGEQRIQVFQIKQVIEVSNDTDPSILVTQENVGQIEAGENTNLGTFFQNSENSINYTIQNTGSEDLILSNYIVTGDGINSVVFNDPFPLTIEPSDSYDFTVILKTNQLATYTSQSINIISNAINNGNFSVVFGFNVITEGSSTSTMALYYGLSQIINDRSFAVSSAPLNISRVISLSVYNLGNNNLVLGSISITGDGSISAGTTAVSGATIAPNNYEILNISLLTTSLGNKTANINIGSNDPDNNPFVTTLNYSVLPQSNIVLTDGVTELIDGEELEAGSLDKGKSFVKSYTINNDGIYKTVIINSLAASEDLSVTGSYALPFILLPNSSNSLIVTVLFDTETVGLKEGIFTVDYSEGSVPS